MTETTGTTRPSLQPGREIQRLLDIMAALRTPMTGCPWDLDQTFGSIAPYTIEEAYEVADAIERGDFADLQEELGDLLLQVVYHARMAEERSLFAFADVVEAITSKLIRRHPHVFGGKSATGPTTANAMWDAVKAEEKAARAARRAALPNHETVRQPAGLLADVPAAMPALTRAVKLQNKAGSVGFDWRDIRAVLAKVREEANEIEAALDAGASRDDIGAEIGDLLFAAANLARHAEVDAEGVLRGANAKFERRFRHIEARLAESDRAPAASTLEEMDRLWDEAKAAGL